MACAICETRRPKRFCPGVHAEICTICCGTEREVTVNCPLDCEFLLESRKHQEPAPIDPAQLPNSDIRVTDRFVAEHSELLTFLAQAVFQAAMETPGAADPDVREALEALIRTYRSLESGLYYDTVPQGLLAAAIYRRVQQVLPEYRRAEQQRLGTSRTRDVDVLGSLVFFQHAALAWNNGRARGRAFLSLLLETYSAIPVTSPPAESSLILP